MKDGYVSIDNLQYVPQDISMPATVHVGSYQQSVQARVQI